MWPFQVMCATVACTESHARFRRSKLSRVPEEPSLLYPGGHGVLPKIWGFSHPNFGFWRPRLACWRFPAQIWLLAVITVQILTTSKGTGPSHGPLTTDRDFQNISGKPMRSTVRAAARFSAMGKHFHGRRAMRSHLPLGARFCGDRK